MQLRNVITKMTFEKLNDLFIKKYPSGFMVLEGNNVVVVFGQSKYKNKVYRYSTSNSYTDIAIKLNLITKIYLSKYRLRSYENENTDDLLSMFFNDEELKQEIEKHNEGVLSEIKELPAEVQDYIKENGCNYEKMNKSIIYIND